MTIEKGAASNTSPLIYLAKIGPLNILKQLYAPNYLVSQV